MKSWQSGVVWVRGWGVIVREGRTCMVQDRMWCSENCATDWMAGIVGLEACACNSKLYLNPNSPP